VYNFNCNLLLIKGAYMMIKLDATRLDSFSTDDWYLNEDSIFLKDVTSSASNLAIGVLDIAVSAPTEAQEKANIVALVKVRTVVGSFSSTVFRKPKNENYLYLQQLQHQYEDPQTKEKKYKNLFSLDSKVVAQILRYVTSLCTISSNESAAATSLTEDYLDLT